jgi:hypothetical protein
MKLEKIIALANRAVRLRFVAMERSLRATGCQLPLRVIPYDDQTFDLPKNAEWWEVPEVTRWLAREHARPVMRKYQCLLEANYQFADADVVFLRNPEQVLAPYTGFVTSCGHWHNPGETSTPASRRIFSRHTTTWQSRVFNTGQFACDRALYDVASLMAAASQPEFIETCVRFRFNEQPGLNLLVFRSRVPVTNLTLPPVSMESTWAGDYTNGWQHFWAEPERKPYLIHWAGLHGGVPRPIDDLFHQFLTRQERAEWEEQVRRASAERKTRARSLRSLARRVKRAYQALLE